MECGIKVPGVIKRSLLRCVFLWVGDNFCLALPLFALSLVHFPCLPVGPQLQHWFFIHVKNSIWKTQKNSTVAPLVSSWYGGLESHWGYLRFGGRKTKAILSLINQLTKQSTISIWIGDSQTFIQFLPMLEFYWIYLLENMLFNMVLFGWWMNGTKSRTH